MFSTPFWNRVSRSDLANATVIVLTLVAAPALAQRGPADLPGYDRYQLVNRNLRSLATGGTISRTRWSEDGRMLHFRRGEDDFVVELDTMILRELAEDEDPPGASDDRDGRRRRRAARGRQRRNEPSPDGQWVAVCRDWNVVLEDAEGTVIDEVTTEGERKHRFGMASWVYGEELDQDTAMWWSPDARWLAYYEFDEREVEDFYLLDGLTELRTSPLIEGYPKPGAPNPIATLHLYDVERRESTRIDTGPADAEGIGHYVFNVRFSPAGDLLLFNRTNRHQNVLEVVAVDPATGDQHVVVREEQETWQTNSPMMRFLEDGHRFVWESEKTGFKHLELRHLSGTLLATLTRGDYPVERLERVDEERGVVFYTAYSGRSPLNAHLHRVGLDGRSDRRLTSEPLNHRVTISPDGQWFVTQYETQTTAPTTALYDADGNRRLTLAESDTSKFDELGLVSAEVFSFTAEDGQTELYGVLYKPSDFDPGRTYPLVIDVYGGPFSRGVRNRYSPVNALCEFGFLVAKIDNRGTVGRGKAFESATYLKLGTVDLQDQADGVRYLRQRPYVDGNRVGIFGSSYGGYMSALAVLKHPDVFHVGVAGSAVTDWRNYDTIYTERYMRTPEENSDGYEQGSCMSFVDRFRGRLLLQHGMKDDNVHPTNAWQLVEKLGQAGQPFDMKFYPNRGHSLGMAGGRRRLSYLYEHLIANPMPIETFQAGDDVEADDASRATSRSGPGIRW
ncbi:MAG: S9 family peptidase [Planctomycetota bacterium]|jgi:dipeptidyl-peptidase-4